MIRHGLNALPLSEHEGVSCVTACLRACLPARLPAAAVAALLHTHTHTDISPLLMLLLLMVCAAHRVHDACGLVVADVVLDLGLPLHSTAHINDVSSGTTA